MKKREDEQIVWTATLTCYVFSEGSAASERDTRGCVAPGSVSCDEFSPADRSQFYLFIPPEVTNPR